MFGSGLTTQEIGKVFGRLYGKNYSSSQVSRMFEYARKDVEEWRKAYPFLDRKNNARIELYFTYLNYDLRIRNMICSTNWIERLNRMYKRVTRMRGALPTSESVLLLLCNVAMDVDAYRYPVTSFRFGNANFKWNID